MVHDDYERVFVLSQARQTDADERATSQIKRPLRLQVQPFLNIWRAAASPTR